MGTRLRPDAPGPAGPSAPVVRRRLVVRGVVQGVGFRPHVARLATDLRLVGRCRNDATCVVVEVEGRARDVADFETRLRTEAPPLARVQSVETTDLAPAGEPDFRIVASTETPGERTLVPPDTAVCADCLRELHDPADRRYRHPFITCTNCGPRLTIILDLPYDRPATTMAGFPLCPACAAEYADPADRRYHAQPVACHDCGPSLTAVDPDGATVAAGTEPALAAAVRALRSGGIVAVKGLGGYHLACDAADAAAVTALRERKQRPDQPFAVMAADLAAARGAVDLPGDAEVLLTSPERPILLLPRRADAPVADGVAPGLDELGVLLPYAPPHHLLFAALPDGSPGAPPLLVMTSGNASGEPLCHEDDDALARLGGLADLFVVHDREIAVPCEDSVLAWSEATGSVPVRRSRGFAPLPVDLRVGAAGGRDVVLAAGAELKNTVALARDGRAFVSAHVGDLESWAGRTTHHRVVDQLLRFHRSTPALVVADRHPGYASRAFAQEFAREHGIPLLEVQHHHAHLASLAAEHGRLEEPLVGLVFDGTGYGCDATVWGGEVLVLTDGGAGFERRGHLGAVRLPGGDAGVRNPVRTAALALLAAGETWEGTAVGVALTPPERSLLARAHESGSGYVDTSSVGRLFDAAASLLGVRHRVSYEAQAAIELEATARAWRRAHPEAAAPTLPLPIVAPLAEGIDPARLDPGPLVAALAGEVRAGGDPGALAWAFHDALARSSAALAGQVCAELGRRTVGLSGGVFVNRVLLALTVGHLRALGLEPLVHRQVPANDGGLALGQVAVGAQHLRAAGVPPDPTHRPPH